MYRFLISALVLIVPSLGCTRGPSTPSADKQVVSVSQPVVKQVRDFVDYTGRTNAKLAVTIQPRVTGYLVKMPFKEGSDVKKDDVLFEVDPRPYEAQLKAAEAQVAQNEAALRYAKATNQRYKELEKKSKGAVSERELDQYQALQDQAIANLDLARANLISAKLNLEWTLVKAPIDGHISRYYLTLGNLVNQDSTQLTTLVSLDPMYAYFDMDEPTMLELKRAVNEGKLSTSKEGADLDLWMGLQGDEGKEDPFPYKGTVNFVDNQVNPGTDSISVRGSFANPKPKNGTYMLVPGMFVRVRLPKGQPYEATLVIDRAVTSNQGLKYVYVVNAENKIEERLVGLGALQPDGLRVINQGLKKDEWVVIGGVQQVRPGMEVQPDQYSMPSLGNPAVPLSGKDQEPPAKVKGKAKKK